MSPASQQEFFARIRAALGARRADLPLPEVSVARTLPADADLTKCFVEHVNESGMRAECLAHREQAVDRVVALVREVGAKTVLLGGPPTPIYRDLADGLQNAGVTLLDPADPEAAFQADAGVTGVHGAIAETGSLVLRAEPDVSRLASLAAPTHIAIVAASQIAADLLDWADRETRQGAWPAQVLISGPSKTADIELNLITGVHGPGRVYVLILKNE